MTSREIEEYRALRATIRQRSTARFWIVLVGFLAWVSVAVAVAALVELPIATLAPLLLLLLTFEIVFAIHTGVERIGRYIQVFFEDEAAERGWEHYAMELGRRAKGSGVDPLFSAHFRAAIALNVLPAALAAPLPIEWMVVGVAHTLAVVRIVVARRQARGQRESDLERFRALRAETSGGGASPTSAPERS